MPSDWYGGDLLPNDPYEEWVADRRQLLHLRRLDLLRIAGDWRELTEIEPTDEDAHVRLMRAALCQFGQLERVLDREFGTAPGEAAQRAFADARRVDQLLVTLSDLEDRHRAVLAELVAVGCPSPCAEQ
jgi:DNA-binding SARP family transcriptional activator